MFDEKENVLYGKIDVLVRVIRNQLVQICMKNIPLPWTKASPPSVGVAADPASAGR